MNSKLLVTSFVLGVAGTIGVSVGAIATPPDTVQRLLKTNQCPLCDLSGTDLSKANLFGANLVGANLKGANLAGANLGSANLEDADASGANFTKAYLHKANLANANLSQANLSEAYLKEAELFHTNFNRAILQKVNLSRTNLTGLNLQGVDLTQANLQGTTLTGFRPIRGSTPTAAFYSAYAEQAACSDDMVGFFQTRGRGDMSTNRAEDYFKAAGVELSAANLAGSTLKGTNLQGALLAAGDLQNADLTDANLKDACLKGSNLKNAKFDGANLTDASLSGAIVDGASFRNAKNAQLKDTFRSAQEAKLGPAQDSAKIMVGSMNRSQQAYFLENDRFTTDMKALGLGIPPNTETYLYRLFVHPQRQAAMNAAVPTGTGRKTYVGLVYVGTTSGGESTTLATLCESLDAKPQLPKWSAIEIPPTNSAQPIPCPAGFQSIP